jgi:hypothetical protein
MKTNLMVEGVVANPTLQGGGLNTMVHLHNGFSHDNERDYCSKAALRPFKTGLLLAYRPQPEGWGWQVIPEIYQAFQNEK